jgi:hypothetical protein
MAALAARTAARRSIFVDGREASVASMDSNAARFLEVDELGEVGMGDEEAGVCVAEDDEGAGTSPDNGGTSTIGRGTAGDGDDDCCDWRLTDIRRGGAGEGGTDE